MPRASESQAFLIPDKQPQLSFTLTRLSCFRSCLCSCSCSRSRSCSRSCFRCTSYESLIDSVAAQNPKSKNPPRAGHWLLFLITSITPFISTSLSSLGIFSAFDRIETPSMTFSHIPHLKTYLLTVSTLRIIAILAHFCIRRSHPLKPLITNPCIDRSGRSGRSARDLYRLYLFLVSLLLPRSSSRQQSLISLQSPPASSSAKPVLSWPWSLPVPSTTWLFSQPNISPTNKTKSHLNSIRNKHKRRPRYLDSLLRSLGPHAQNPSSIKKRTPVMGSFTFKW
jgi:hypothetical protein